MTRSSHFDSQLEAVANSLGIAVSRIGTTPGVDFDYEVRIKDYPIPKGFSLLIGDDYLSWNIRLRMDESSMPLLVNMRSNFESRKSQFESVVELCKDRSRNFSVKIDGLEFDPSVAEYHFTDLSMEISQNYSSESSEFEVLFTTLLDAFCIVLSLLLEPDSWHDESIDDGALGKEEGSEAFKLIRRYERSRYNRALCLKYYGFTCRGCGNTMADKYGPYGDGVIHVHHIVPVSMMGGSYRINPIKDLRPLCPNCHNVVHRITPPLTIDELNQLTGYSID